MTEFLKEVQRDEHCVLPLRDLVLFPGMVVPLFIGRPKSGAAIERVSETEGTLLALAQKDPLLDAPTTTDLFRVGTLCNVLQVIRLPDGSYKVLLEGLNRHCVTHLRDEGDENSPFMAQSFPLPEVVKSSPRLLATVRYVTELFEDFARLNRKIPRENLLSIINLEDPGVLADQMAAHMAIKVEEKQKLLTETNVHERLTLLAHYLERENEILEIEKKVKGDVRGAIDRSQREFYISEQIKALQKELGRDGEPADEIDEYRERWEKAALPQEVHERADKEINRLATMPIMSPEATVVRTYLDWLFDLPWNEATEETLDLSKAERVLNRDHYGLKKPKERILEHLAVRKLNPGSRGPILCFVGPPGVGKTSLGRSIASATNRKFARISLGGMRDEAEIRGHRRTYIGSLPGRIVQTLKKVQSNNPVILLDEIDKMSSDFRGDPASALLEALDPEQNKHFVDNYLEVEFDLSQVFFITTANLLHPVPPALRDRMEVIEISSYIEEEKVQIAKQYLIPRAIKETGLKRAQIAFRQDGIRETIRSYTREAGVRNLEREIQSVCRKVARGVAVREDDEGPVEKTVVDAAKVQKLLGIPKFLDSDRANRDPDVGFATGLAWTEVGGTLLTIEVSILEGKGELVLTGQLGKVMQESGRAALSYARSLSHEYGIPKDFHKRYDIHIHLPEGAIPKDGPSAGVTLATALISALAHIPVRPDLAMTGEITLRGKVLPVGGIREKLLAAHRSGIRDVLIPEENQKDLEDIPEKILKVMKVHTVSRMREVLSHALVRR
jgi:ATP-dependent Lon protease